MKLILKAFLSLLILGACGMKCEAVETAEQLIERCASKINKAPSMTIKFNLSFGDKKSDCQLIVSREKYRLSSSDIEVWFDGTTQWSYSSADREVSITEPTIDEQLECNPFAILNNFKSAYNVRRLSGEKNEIEMTAKNKMSTVRKAVITINGTTGLPSKLVVTMSNGRTFSAVVTSAVEGKRLPSTTFVYDKAKYPANTVVDLR